MNKKPPSSDKTFSNWTEDDLILTFGLRPQKSCEHLEKWLCITHEFTDFEQAYIEKFLLKIQGFINTWNEAELRAKFIDPLTAMVDYDSLPYFLNAFSERPLQTTLANVTLKGKIDWMVATGRNHPQNPFFFIHEYKKESGGSEDPLAQLLAAMLAAQTLHQIPPTPNLLVPKPTHFYKNMPVYGCYIIGRNWFFVTLYNKEYCVSNSFNATEQEDLYKIIYALKTQKLWILEMVKKHLGKLF
ncbi:MAG: hypothetical protein ACPGVB_09770 [Chitinophagales bacterium]